MRKRRLRGRKLKKQRRIIIASILTLTLLLSTGYAAFSTNISLSAKGNIKEKPASEKIIENETVQEASSTVDGLYKDTYEEPVDGKYRYIYKGADPDNYFTFNDEEAGWRIVSIESDGTIKIIKKVSLGAMTWDGSGERTSSTDTYCTSSGCNAWAKTSRLTSNNSTFSTNLSNGIYYQYGLSGGTTIVSGNMYASGEFFGTVTKDASLNTYLNGTYYTSTLESNINIDKHDFYVSTPGSGSDTDSIATDVEQEKLYAWNGYVGLITATDYMKATINSTCTTLYAAYNTANNCNPNNWLYFELSYFTISPFVNSARELVWRVGYDGCLSAATVGDKYQIHPVLFLKSDIILKGSGTSGSPYYIDES